MQVDGTKKKIQHGLLCRGLSYDMYGDNAAVAV